LRPVVENFDAAVGPVSESDIDSAIRQVLQARPEPRPARRVEEQAEVMAFGFMEAYADAHDGQGDYFGPKIEWPTKNGKLQGTPSLELITPTILEYWQARSQEARHAVMRARYADLVWDQSPRVTGKAAAITCAHTAIDSYVAIAQGNLYKYIVEAIPKIRRALYLAISVNDVGRIGQVRDACMAMEDQAGKDEWPGTWGFAFDLLIDDTKVSLSDAQRDHIIARLEGILATMAALRDGAVTTDPFAAKAAALKLATYYRRHNRLEDVHRVLRLYGGAFIRLADQAAGGIASAWLHELYEVYREYGMKADADAVAVKLREIGARSKAEMVSHTVKVSIPKAKIDQFLAELAAGSLNQALEYLAVNFVPSLRDAEQMVHDSSKSSVFMSLVGVSIMGEDGRPEAKLGNVNEDFDSRVALQMGQLLGGMKDLLHLGFEHVRTTFSPSADQVLGYLTGSPLFSEDVKPILASGLGAYLRRDYVASIHILLPQIEVAVRRLAECTGCSTYKPNRHGGLDLKILDDLLREDAVVNVLGAPVQRYLRVLLVDRAGWNIRNLVCHGKLDGAAFSWPIADRVMHALLLLGMFRAETKPPENSPPSDPPKVGAP
jgi:hypothetical protein